MQTPALRALIVLASVAPLACSAQSMVHKSAAETKYAANPGLPACSTMAVQDGDPSQGAAVIALKTNGHCVIPWHWHTGNERVIVVSGMGKMEMKDMPPATVHHGDFMLMPAKGVHQFTSETASEVYIITDAPFDIHYVDSAGKELTPEEALKNKPGV